jgi:putative phosphoesterase
MIGIMSDSHDNLDAVKEAVRLFKSLDCQLVIHAGDFVAPFAALEMSRLSCKIKAVFGNCDGEKKGLAAAIKPFGEIEDPPHLFEWTGFQFLLMHVEYDVNALVARYQPDFLVFGHTHKPEIKTRGKTLLVNPGETGGWVSGRKTVALLDPERRTAEIHSL